MDLREEGEQVEATLVVATAEQRPRSFDYVIAADGANSKMGTFWASKWMGPMPWQTI